MTSRVLTPALAAAARRATTEAAAAGELRPAPAGSTATRFDQGERELILAWRSSGEYDRILADIVAGDPDLATRWRRAARALREPQVASNR